MKIGQKLVSAFVLISVLSLIVGLTGWSQITNVNSELNDITSKKVPAMDSSMEMEAVVLDQRDTANSYVLGEEDAKSDLVSILNKV